MSSATGPSSSSKDVSFDVEEKEKPDHHNDKETDSEAENNITRKFSSASLCSTDGGDGDDDDDDEEDLKNLVPLGPQLALKEQLEMDKDDESLRKWKEQLLAGVDLSEVGENPEPEVKILSLAICSPDRPDLVLPIPFVPDSKGYAFALKDGSRYRLKFSFTVSNNVVLGLRYTNTVWKAGVRVENTKVMLGAFSPQKEPYTYELEEEVTPSGIFARGSYSAKTKFVDDDGKCYLDINYYFEIRKEWPLSLLSSTAITKLPNLIFFEVNELVPFSCSDDHNGRGEVPRPHHRNHFCTFSPVHKYCCPLPRLYFHLYI